MGLGQPVRDGPGTLDQLHLKRRPLVIENSAPLEEAHQHVLGPVQELDRQTIKRRWDSRVWFTLSVFRGRP